MADQLLVIDGALTVVEDHPAGRLYALAARIEGGVSRPSLAEIGPAMNALYAQALESVLVDPSLGGLVSDVRESDEITGRALEIEMNIDPFSAASGIFGLNVAMPYWQPEGAAPRREQILEALTAAVAANQPGPGPCMREQALVAFHAWLEEVCGRLILRNADRPVDCSSGTSVVVFRDGEQTADYSTMGRVFYASRAAIEVFVPGKDAALLDSVLQDVLIAVRSAETLGGLAVDVVEVDSDPDVLRELYTGPLLVARVNAEVVFATPVGKPYAGAA